MLTNFALISELLTIDHGKYVVRVMVFNQDRAIASGLAAAETVEIAEDRARERAIAVVNKDLNSELNNGQSFSPQKTSSPTDTVAQFDSKSTSVPNKSTVQQTLNLASSNDLVRVKSSKTTLKNQEQPSSTQKSLASKQLPLIDENELGKKIESSPHSQPSEDFSLKASQPDNLNPNLSIAEETAEEKEAFSETNTTQEESTHPQESLNWDLISRTNIELKRLGWTQDQGRNYLLETYGKKSRHLLTDEELIEFCHYLESQSSNLEPKTILP